MKTDVMIIVILVFCLGVLASSVGLTKVFESEPTPPGALQQGVATR